MTNKESLPYEEFARLSDKDIIQLNPLELLNHVKNTKEEDNYKLYVVVANHMGDSMSIRDSDFELEYHNLRKDRDPKRIFREYPNLVSKFDEKR